MASEWFMECKRVLEQLQKERLAEEESLKDEKRAKYLEELRPEINILDEVASKGGLHYAKRSLMSLTVTRYFISLDCL